MKFEKERERKQIRKKRERGYMQVTRKGDSYNKSRERSTKREKEEGRGGGRVVSVLAFFSKDSEFESKSTFFLENLCLTRTKIERKRGRDWATFFK